MSICFWAQRMWHSNCFASFANEATHFLPNTCCSERVVVKGNMVGKFAKENKEKFKVMPKDEYLPGEGQYYCISCARYFPEKDGLKQHFKTKQHKRRLKSHQKHRIMMLKYQIKSSF